MKFNQKELADLSQGEPTIEGRLHHKKISGGYSHSVFKEKWFKLRANILFYFNLSETGQIFDKKPVGALILENVIVQYEMHSEVPFSFSIYFNDELEKKHLFSGRTQENINKWVAALKEAGYEYWRSQLILLQEKLKIITGKDPLLMYPRNEGCRNVSKNLPENSYQAEGVIKVENSRFHFYSVKEDSRIQITEKEKKESSTGKNFISTCVENKDIAVPDIPPVRPARGNKPKQDVTCGNLIDL